MDVGLLYLKKKLHACWKIGSTTFYTSSLLCSRKQKLAMDRRYMTSLQQFEGRPDFIPSIYILERKIGYSHHIPPGNGTTRCTVDIIICIGQANIVTLNLSLGVGSLQIFSRCGGTPRVREQVQGTLTSEQCTICRHIDNFIIPRPTRFIANSQYPRSFRYINYISIVVLLLD